MSQFADSHTHLLSENMQGRAGEIIENFDRDNIAFVVEIGCDPDDARAALEFAKKHNRVYCAVGVHPHYATQYNDEFETWLKQQNPYRAEGSPLVVAVGECGLDYYHDLSPRETQREVFVKQIKLSHELGLPLIIHSRDAFDDTFDILKKNKELLTNGVVMHSFGYGAAEAGKLSKEIDCYFSFSGSITYKFKSQDEADRLVKSVPTNRIMVETDCPYLAPVPLRGQINEPKNVRYIIEAVARALCKPYDEVAKTTLENTKRFFRV